MLYNTHRDADVVKFDLIARTLCLHCIRGLLGMTTKLERLLVHKADIETSQRNAPVRLRAELESIEYSRRRSADEWRVPHHVMQSALLIYMECDWTVEPASKCLSMRGVRKRWRTLRPVVLQDMLEREFLATDEDDLLKLLSAHEQRADTAAMRAHTYILDLRLTVWCRSMNSKHGVASSTADVLKKSVQRDATRTAAVHSKTRTGRPSTIARKCESCYDDV